MTPRLAAIPRQIRSLMDALCVANLVLYLTTTFVYDFRGWEPQVLISTLALRIAWALIIAGLWLVIRRSGRIVWVVGFCVLAIIGTGMDEFSMLVMAIVVVYVFLGNRAGLILVATSVVVYTLPILVARDAWSPSESALIVVRFLITIATPTLIGQVLRRGSEVLEQLSVANGELGRANREIRERASLDQDLMLAEERARAARELHDGLGHQLTVAGMSLDFASHSLPGQRELALSEVDEARRVVSETLSDVRSWAQALQPVDLQASGLGGLPALVRGLGTGELSVDLNLPDRLPVLGHRQELFVTRFVQEGLTNAVKHARAARVEVVAEVLDQRLMLRLSNDGWLPAEVTEGFGLRSLRERAEEVAGEFRAEVSHGGFTLRADIPLVVDKLGVGVA